MKYDTTGYVYQKITTGTFFPAEALSNQVANVAHHTHTALFFSGGAQTVPVQRDLAVCCNTPFYSPCCFLCKSPLPSFLLCWSNTGVNSKKKKREHVPVVIDDGGVEEASTQGVQTRMYSFFFTPPHKTAGF
jgi:hypothetical protein